MQHNLLAAVSSAAAVGVWLSERLGCMFFRRNLQLHQRPAEVEPSQRYLECMLVRDSSLVGRMMMAGVFLCDSEEIASELDSPRQARQQFHASRNGSNDQGLHYTMDAHHSFHRKVHQYCRDRDIGVALPHSRPGASSSAYGLMRWSRTAAPVYVLAGLSAAVIWACKNVLRASARW